MSSGMNNSRSFEHMTWFRRHGAAVVANVLGQKAELAAPVVVRRLVDRPGIAVLDLDLDGTRVIAKIFTEQNSDPAISCEREAFAMLRLKDSGLAPRLYTFATEEHFLVSEFVFGDRLDTRLTGDNLVDWARKIGAWSARYIARQPRRDHAIDWFGYMALYRGVISDEVEDTARERYGGVPVGAFALAKHDLDPSNFIVRPDGGLVGIDYERTRFKPVGWDIIAAAWVLMDAFPDREGDIVPALIAGWNSAAAEPLPDHFEHLATFFAHQATALR